MKMTDQQSTHPCGVIGWVFHLVLFHSGIIFLINICKGVEMTGKDLIDLIIEKGLTQEEINAIETPVIHFYAKTIKNASKEGIVGQVLVLCPLSGCSDDGYEVKYSPGDLCMMFGRTPETSDFHDKEFV